MKILVPVDFHKTSFSAYYYAAQLAEKIGGQITLLHVVNGTFNTYETARFDPLKTQEDLAHSRLDYFANEYPKELKVEMPNTSVRKAVTFGIPGFTIAQYAEDQEMDLIVMGTKDKHGIFDRFMGSASLIAIRQAKCPIVLIHKMTKFNDPKKIVFAFDGKRDLEDSLDAYHEFNTKLQASTDFIHINDGKGASISQQKEQIIDELFDESVPNYTFEIKEVAGDDVIAAIKDYCLFEKADMLAMVHRKEGILTGIFNKFQTIKMVDAFHLPLIIFQEKQN